MPYIINGLPLHILLVHFVVIVLPGAAIMTVLGSVWPAFRRKLGIVTPIVALLGLISVPLATNAGEWLEERVNSTPLIQAHVAVGDTLLPWAVGQFLVAAGIWAWYRFFAAPKAPPAAPRRRVSETVPVGAGIGAASSASGVGDGASPRSSDGTPDFDGASASSTEHGASASSRSTATATGGGGRRRASLAVSLVVSIVWIVLAVGVSAGTIAKVVQIGESGSSAVWQGSFSETPTEG